MRWLVVSCVLLVAAVLLVGPAGAPLQLTYVYSDSMAPTIGTDDGFFVSSTGSVETGDIVTFRSPGQDRYVTHRVVGRTDEGFITRGDANRVTDQATGAPYVTRDDVVGTVVTYQGQPLIIPGYGAAVTWVDANHDWILLGLALLLVGRLTLGREQPLPRRNLLRGRDVLDPLFAGAFVAAVAIILFGAGVHQLSFVAVAGEATGPSTVTVGEPLETSVTANVSRSPFTTPVVTGDSLAITDRSRNGSQTHLAVRGPPPATTGRHVVRIAVYRYPAVVPAPVLRQLAGIHPALPAGITAAIVLAPVYLLSWCLVDRNAPLRPSKLRWHQRLRRVIR